MAKPKLSCIFPSCPERRESHEDDVIFPTEDVNTVLTSVKKLLQYDMRRRQATAIVLMGVIGAEFQREVELYKQRSGKKHQTGLLIELVKGCVSGKNHSPTENSICTVRLSII